MLNHHNHHHDHHHHDHKQQQQQEEELLQLMPLHHHHHHHHHHHQINTPNPNDHANPQSTGNLLLISPNHFNSPAAISSCPTHDFMVYNHNHNHNHHDNDDDDDGGGDDDYNIIAHNDTTMIGASCHLMAANSSMNNEVRPSSISGCSSSGGDEENHVMNQARSSHHDISSTAATNGKRLSNNSRSSTLRYIKYSAEQVEALEVLYHHCPKPSSATRQQLIQDNPLLRHIHPQQIKVWFQNRRCREKQRRETTRLQSVNGKLIAMNKLLMEENERLQKQVSHLMHEKDHLLQHLHNHVPLAPSPLNLPPPTQLNPNRNIINHNYTNTTTDNHGTFNLSPCYV